MSADADEKQLLERAAQERVREIGFVQSEESLRQIVQSEGIDYATARLYDQIVHSPQHSPGIAALDALREQPAGPTVTTDALLAIAPGAFYVEYPSSGADGRLLGEQAAALGLVAQLIPTRSMGSIEENGQSICEWLLARKEQRIILASVSKGGSDIKSALRRPEASDAFRNVQFWISLCGILDGSPAVEWLLRRTLRELCYRALFWSRGLRFQVITDLRRASGCALDFPLQLPEHMQLIQIVGFPLRSHLTNRLARVCHGYCADLGPNDGAVLLSDVMRKPGLIYPIWGADHYLRPSWALRSLGTAVLRYVLRSLPTCDAPQRKQSAAL